MKNKKKKGFTLIELIAVIAILGILAAIIIPRVTSYTDRATTSRNQANARSILSAIEIYNAEAGANQRIPDDATMTEITVGTDLGATDVDLNTTLASYTELDNMITEQIGKTGSNITGTTTVTAVRGEVD